ncbi:MAG: RICIN domain-containing protein [Firmicutes bacterium]|nr:RICIN domain-containing protein [Bacillota bacterium]
MKLFSKLSLLLIFLLFIGCMYIFTGNNNVKAEFNNIDNGLYKIRNVYSGLYLDIQDGSNANGALCVQALGADNSNQVFKISKDVSLRYVLSMEKNLKIIEIKDDSKEPGAFLQQWDFSSKFNQLWDIRILSDGTVVFINYLTNAAITTVEGDLNAGSLVTAEPYAGTANQKWTLEPVEKTFINNKVQNSITPESTSIINGFFGNLTILQLIIGGFTILLFMFFAIGQILYGFRIKSRLIIKGKLYYKPTSREDEKFINYLDLKRKHKRRLMISFDQNYKKADFYIGDSSYTFQLIIEKVSEMNLPHFLEGYRSFNKDRNPIKLRVSATEPGILNFGEFVYSKHFIVDGSKFDSGDILFRYVENEKN